MIILANILKINNSINNNMGNKQFYILVSGGVCEINISGGQFGLMDRDLKFRIYDALTLLYKIFFNTKRYFKINWHMKKQISDL